MATDAPEPGRLEFLQLLPSSSWRERDNVGSTSFRDLGKVLPPGTQKGPLKDKQLPGWVEMGL